MKSKMLPKPSEGVNAKKTKCSSSKSSIRNRNKKFEGGNLKDKSKLRTNIPPSAPLMRSRSYEKSCKPDTTHKRTKMEEKGKYIRSKSASEKYKIPPKEPVRGILEKIALVSKNNVSGPAKYPLQKPLNNEKTEGNKFKLKGFTQLLPLWEKDLKRIEDAWLNTVYCSLSTRANLFKFLVQLLPNVEKSQFHLEDKKLLQRFDQVKISSQTEADNLLNLVQSLLTAREKTKEEYQNMLKNDKDPSKKIMEEDIKQLKAETLEPPKKKDAAETTETEKPQKTENSNKKKDLSFMSFFSFGNHQNTNNPPPKQNESNPKQVNAPLNAEESNETKPEVAKLTTLQKDFEALKAKYSSENEIYEKKIKDLETLLEEKIRILKQEKEVKNQLQICLTQFQAQQKRLSKTLGNDELEYLVGSSQTRDKRREELWLTAIKLILKGFFIQLKNLEMERNKMLFQLQSNDSENFNALAASIIQKDNFVKSIKQQMKSFSIAYQKRKNKEN